jgi:GntR family transcriptional regulator, carbon starvation induced regulator
MVEILTGAEVDQPLTRTEWATHRLRRAILSGELQPGEKLVATALATDWNISPTPLRDAFARLAESGLVELTPQRGARVARLSMADAVEIFELRLLLEPVALRESLARTDEAHLGRVVALLEQLEKSVDAGLLEDSLVAHRRFHAALLERCPGAWLRKFCEMLSEHSGRYAMLTPFHDDETVERMKEHTLLVDALRERSVDDAVAILTEHLARSLARLQDRARDVGEIASVLPVAHASTHASTGA